MNLDEIIKNPKSISIDSRTIKKGNVFLAIKGERFDGHDFVEEAFKKGAQAVIISRRSKLPLKHKDHVIKVRNTVDTLGDIARSHRLKFNIPIIAITGSNGKTTAKDMVSHVLSSRYNVLKNESSKNNLIGLPLTLLGLEKKYDVAVLEMGMNRLGEIDRLSEIARPHIGVITNIGPSHLKFLGTLKNVFIAKSELLKRLSNKDIAILNRDDAYLRGVKGIKCKKVYFGIERRCPFQATKLSYRQNKWSFSLEGRLHPSAGSGLRFELALLGKHNIYNALVAIAIARQFNIDFSTIEKRIKSYRQICPMRLESKNFRGIEILDDSYNSNPLSMECAIDTLARYNTDGKRIVVSGDMLELGPKTKTMHKTVGKIIASSPISLLITLGGLSKSISREAKQKGMNDLYHAESHSDAAAFLRKVARPGDVVLVKGSRAMRMERVIEAFRLE